ncbi:MAG: hypothetical protein ACR2G7_07455 [Acidimicrobiales bacterium]
MAATGSFPARPRATTVDQGGAGLGSSPQQASPSATSFTDAGPGDDWAAQAADAVERVVGSVRAKTTEPLERVARILVYGLLALIVGLAAAVLAAVGLVRALDLAIPGGVWSAHALTGGIFGAAGLFLWRKRTVKTVKV